MDKFVALRAFIEVAEAGGFSSAARRLNQATSSVMRSVDALEASLGTALLNRTTRQVTLSDAGTTYYAKAKRLLDDMADADASVSDRDGEPAGPLRVSVPAAYGTRVIAPNIARFMTTYPKIDLDLRLSDSLVDLVADRIDVAIRLGELDPSADVISRRIGVFSRYVVASDAYLARAGFPASPEDLTNHACLRFSLQREPQTWTFARDGRELKVRVNGRLKANSAETLREAALDGFGVALLADWLVESDVKRGALTRLFADYGALPDNARSVISALYLPNQRGSRRVNAFIEFIASLSAASE